MKKSTLISTLAMVVIVALALTTATFAWYTANSSVQGSGTAVSATAASANLAIGKNSNPSDSGNIDLSSKNDLVPMAPKDNWSITSGSKTSYSVASGNLYSSTIESGENAKFTSTPESASTPITGIFYVKNLSAGTEVDITISLDAKQGSNAKDGSRLLRVAIFVGSTGTAEYAGLLGLKKADGNNADTKYGEINDETVASSLSNTTVGAAESLSNFATLGKSDSGYAEIAIQYIAWFDGASLTTDNQGAGCEFTLIVTGSTHTETPPAGA